MRIEIVDKLVSRLAPEYAERQIILSPSEVAILQKAITICKQAEKLEAEINRLAGDSDERYESDYAWAQIHLTSILRG